MPTSNPLICILPSKLGLGGPASFQSNLVSGLRKRGVEVCFDPNRTDISSILVIGGTRHLNELRKAKGRGIPIIQRLNGLNWVHRRKWTGLRHFLKAEMGNLVLALIRRMADQIVYQSEFARDWWQKEMGEVAVPQSVIYNGVDLEFFTPSSNPLPENETRLLMVEGHHGGGYDQGLNSGVELLRFLQARKGKPVSLTVVGDVPLFLKNQYNAEDLNIHWLGIVDHARIPEIDRSSHLFFSSDVNAACPNAVLEALASGLPVIGFNTGSLPELVQGEAGMVVSYGGDVWKLEPPDVSSLAAAADKILFDQQRYSGNARKIAEAKFSLDLMTEKYLQVLH